MKFKLCRPDFGGSKARNDLTLKQGGNVPPYPLGRSTEVMWEMWDHVDRANWGGPVPVTYDDVFEMFPEKDGAERADWKDLTDENWLPQLASVCCSHIPADEEGWGFQGRNTIPLESPNTAVDLWWVKLYGTQRNASNRPTVIIFDSPGYLLDDTGKTLESIGPSF